MAESKFHKLLRQHERLRRARDHAFVWCAVFALLFIPALASLIHELTRESEPTIAGQLTLMVLALPIVVWTFRAGLRHHRALKALASDVQRR